MCVWGGIKMKDLKILEDFYLVDAGSIRFSQAHLACYRVCGQKVRVQVIVTIAPLCFSDFIHFFVASAKCHIVSLCPLSVCPSITLCFASSTCVPRNTSLVWIFSQFGTSVLNKYTCVLSIITGGSGVTKKILDPITTRLEDVQTDLRRILPSDAILCGQSLNADLLAVQVSQSRGHTDRHT